MFRVLRLIEYTYETVERMQTDMSHWGVPASGSKTAGNGLIIRSAVLPFEVLPVDVPTDWSEQPVNPDP